MGSRWEHLVGIEVKQFECLVLQVRGFYEHAERVSGLAARLTRLRRTDGLFGASDTQLVAA